MNFRRVLWVLSFSALCLAQSDTVKLPVRRVVLYKNGVGYFEHNGRVRGNQDLTVDFTSSQLNDALKSLTLIDQGQGKITGVRYNSATPLDQQLKTLHVALGQTITYADLLNSLRGSHVELRDRGEAVTGRILAVEDRELPVVNQRASADGDKAPQPITQSVVSVVSDGGDVRSFLVSPSLSVKPLEGEMRDDLSRYLQMLASARAQDLRRMTVSTSGQGDRDIFVSYISEVPVWKTSYRLLLPQEGSNKQALLQGWAIVDNTVGEDWNNVQLSLVSGAPQSFVQDLSQPQYMRRPEVALPETVMVTPQSHEGGVTSQEVMGLASNTDRQFDRVQQFAKLTPAPPPPSAKPSANAVDIRSRDGLGAGVGGGIGIGSGNSVDSSHGSVGHAFATHANSTPDMYGQLQHLESASGRDLAGLFEYKVAQPVTIAKNQSALVPILNTSIDAEHVTLWSAQQQVPLRAIWLKNTSDQTLDGGSFSILDNNAFAGEGIFDVIHPKERRLLSYAVDDAVRVSRDGERERKPLKHLRIAKGVMVETTEEREYATYTVRNADGHARSVIIEHPKYDGWKLVSETQPEETTSALQRFRVKVAANDESTLKVEQVHPLLTTVALNDVTPDRIIMLLKYKGAKQELAPQLQRVLDQRAALADIDRRISDLLTEETDIGKDQQRLRENMKALKGSVEERALLHRYTTELNAQEDRLAELKRQQLKESINRQKAQSLLGDTISNTTFDGDL